MVCEETKMISKLDVRVPAEGGIGLGAWLFLPKGDGAHPAITMAHGFAGTREHGLERFARAFATAGFVVLVHDHRNFGTSGGDLRGDVDPWVQIRDWRRGISYLKGRPAVDPARMYELGTWITRVSPTPLLLVVARDDRLTAADLALAAYERALEPKRLALIPGGHFDPYLGQFPLAEAAATEWFHEHLLNPNASRP